MGHHTGSTAANLVPPKTNLYNDGSSTQNQRQITVTATPPASARMRRIRSGFTLTPRRLRTACITRALHPHRSHLGKYTLRLYCDNHPSPHLKTSGPKDSGRPLNNTGNKNVTYNLSLDNLDDDKIKVCFSEEMQPIVTESTLLVQAGSQGIVRIYSTAGQDSRADEDQRFFLNASHDGQLMSTSSGRCSCS